MSFTYATFNPSDKSANITLSNGDLTAQSTISGWCSVRATIGVSSGKWYWEYSPVSGGTMLGFAKSTASLSTFIGGDSNGWAYYLNGQKYTNSSGASYGASFTTETIGVALDMDAGTVVFYKNNASQGTAFTGLTGTIYPAVGLSATNGIVNANFGATTMAYTAPSGYNQGVYIDEGGSPAKRGGILLAW